MKLKIVNKSIVAEQTNKKHMRLRIVERKYSTKTVINEGGIANTLARNLYDYVKEYIIRNDVDPNKEITINVRPEIERFVARSKKFDIPLDKFVIVPLENKRVATSDADYQHNKEVATDNSDSAEDAERKKESIITIKMPIGIDPKEYSNYKNPPKVKTISEEDFNKKVKDFFEKNVIKLYSFPDIKNIKYTNSNDVNKSILDDIKSKNFMALDIGLKPGGKYTQEAASSSATAKFIPGSKERRAAVTAAFERAKLYFFTKIHETTHALQYKGGADNSIRIGQLNNIIGKETYINELLPKLDFYSYSKKPITEFQPVQGDNFGNFFYLSRPIEINARISAYREHFKAFKKEDRESAPSKLFEKINYEEEFYKTRISGQDSLATEELQNKFMYQFYYILLKDAPDIFRTDPGYQEKLNEYKAKVDEINSKLNKLTDERSGTRSSAPDSLKQQYLVFLLRKA